MERSWMASLFCLGLASYILPAQQLAGFGFGTTSPGDWLICHPRSEGRPERGFTSFLWSSTRLARQGWAHGGLLGLDIPVYLDVLESVVGGLNGIQLGENSGTINVQVQAPPRPQKPPSPGIFIPFSRNLRFVDRGDILDRIAKKFNQHQYHTRVAIVGLGGAGKSQLAIEYVRRLDEAQKSHKRRQWIFWIDASTRVTFEQDFRAIADYVDLPGREDEKVDILQLVRRWLSDEHNGEWIIVLDGADDRRMFYPDQSDSNASKDKIHLEKYLPQSHKGSILITTRDMDLARDLTGNIPGNIFEIGSMTQDEAVELLASRLERPPNPETARDLVEKLDRIPLAIVQAAAYIQVRQRLGYSPEKYLADFRDMSKKSKLLQHAAHDLHRSGDDEFEKDLLTLLDYCLVSVTEAPDQESSRADQEASIQSQKLSMHALVQFWTKWRLEREGVHKTFKQHFIKRMAALFPWSEYKNWTTCRTLLPHIQAVFNYNPEEDIAEEWATLLHNAGRYLYEQGNYELALQTLTKAENARKQRLGERHRQTLVTRHEIASVLLFQGESRKAEELLEQVLEAEKEVLGHNHPNTLTTMHNLATTYISQGRFKEAEELYIQVLEARKEVLGPNHPSTLTAMHNLASTYESQGRFKEAEELETKVPSTLEPLL
ncbi:hypothetical protein VTJ04DRAFT_840 [Mycothermus thermophilus]|uniref:uncharacterized protein n=1 Tax=Humicola insolens TaxID=85995 RepID=UPI003741FA20